jgi:uncharacterized repeat protein (TIGR01451 family)
MNSARWALGLIAVVGGLTGWAVSTGLGQSEPGGTKGAAPSGRVVAQIPQPPKDPGDQTGPKLEGPRFPAPPARGVAPAAPAAGTTGTAAPARSGDEPPSNSPGQTPDNPTGRQEPSVSLEWIGPALAKVGQPVSYQIVVKNTSSTPVYQVVVRNRMPAGVTVGATEPRAVSDGSLLIWDLGTLQPRQEKRLDLQIIAETKGDVACQAWVTFTGASVARLRVREPKLTLKAQAPDKVMLGDSATVTLTVTNPGDGPADHVKVKAVLPEGLEHARGKAVEFDLGNLGPNESRSVQLVCTTKTGGVQKCDAVATAEGNLMARDEASLDVIQPKIDIAVTGPRLRYLDRHAIYVLKVTNKGSAPANNVTVYDTIPQGFKFVSASDGGRHDFATRTVSWFVGDLTPNQSREVKVEVVAVNTGEHTYKATAVAARGLKAETDYLTRVEGLPALLMELVDLDDPVEVGADTAYEIRVTNTGSKTETNLQLICTIPDKMEFRSAQAQGGLKYRVEGKEIIFEPLPKLAPRADALYRVSVRGIAPGDLRFKARITADGLSNPVNKEESTKVYGDEGAPIKE